MSEKTILIVLVAATVTGLITISTLSGYASASIDLENATLLTPNEIAAGGPIPPNYTLAQQEAECVAADNNPPSFQTLSAFENYNSNRSHYWSCSHFPVHLQVLIKCMRIDPLKGTILLQ